MINEIRSVDPDFVEFVNNGSTAVDVSGWTFTDSDPTHVFTFAANTVVQPGAFLTIDTGSAAGQFDFGLGGGDSVILRNATSTTPVDSHTWSGQANTVGRCPNGTGGFAFQTMTVTKNAANACSADGGTD